MYFPYLFCIVPAVLLHLIWHGDSIGFVLLYYSLPTHSRDREQFAEWLLQKRMLEPMAFDF